MTNLALATKEVIEVQDLHTLDRIGRYEVAERYFAKCSPAARDALIHDEHPHVRSCAALAQAGLDPSI